ncbi:hypothetical protein D3C77_686820 [compost metagenome]
MDKKFSETINKVVQQTQTSGKIVENAMTSMSQRVFSSYIDQLAEDWNSYSQEEKADIAKSIAGVKDLSIFLALMDSKAEH